MPQPPYLQAGESVVLYDGVCKLCTGWVRFLLRHRLACCAIGWRGRFVLRPCKVNRAKGC